MNDENEKFPVSLITLPIAVVVIPLLYMVLCDLLIDSGYNDLCLPTMMAAILLMAVTLMIGTKLTPQQSGTYKGITYKFNLHLKSEIVCAVISGIPTVVLFILYLAVPPESRTTPITVVWLISMIAIVVAVFGFHPHSSVKTNAEARKGNTNVITGVNSYNNRQYFIDLHNDHLIYTEGDIEITLRYDEITLLEIETAKRTFDQKHNIRTYVNGVETIEPKIPHKLHLQFVYNNSIIEKTLTIEDNCLDAYKALDARRDKQLSDSY